jgi:chemotaxis protein MotB
LARKKKPPEHVNHERWLVSYADFITLLFAFFTTLYAISTVDAQKMGKMVMSMRASFDSSLFEAGSQTLALSQGSGGVGGSAPAHDLVSNTRVPKDMRMRDSAIQGLKDLKSNFQPRQGNGSAKKSLGTLKNEVESLVGAEALKGSVRTRLDSRGLIISLGEIGFFDSGNDELRPEGRALLDTLATSLVSLDNHIRIEGHTDNVPIRTSRFPSNWELSTARATTIVSYLVTNFGFAPDRLSAAGYAEFRPSSSNETVEGRARNRRVDIIVMDPRYALAEPH